MNLAMVRLYCGESGKMGYYNLQELGLANALAKHGLNIYIMILNVEIKVVQEEFISKNITIIHVPAKKIKSHGLFNCKLLLDYNIDVVHLQSDNQIYAPYVMNFCENKNIKCYNYVGTLYTDSSSFIKNKFMNIISSRNIRYFKKFTTYVKTPAVRKQLELKGVKSNLVPVGLDTDNIPYIKESKEELRVSLNLPVDKKILIFVGRLETYKKPFEAIELIKKLNANYKLILIGKGSLKKDILLEIEKNGLEEKIYYLETVPNNLIHKYYKLSDFFVNFNDKEIFGMSILEAMYQKCTIVAKKAPGPSFIIESPEFGFIANNLEEMVSCIKCSTIDTGLNAHERVVTNFNWNTAASVICSAITK